MSSCYQSPIVLDKADSIKIHQTLEIYGRNEDAVYNQVTQNYEVKRNIILTIKNKKYRLDEYHFHNPSEHKVNGHMYPAEIHYVFIEFDNEIDNEKEDCKEIREHSNICCCHFETVLSSLLLLLLLFTNTVIVFFIIIILTNFVTNVNISSNCQKKLNDITTTNPTSS
jgi:hypothetical protein